MASAARWPPAAWRLRPGCSSSPGSARPASRALLWPAARVRSLAIEAGEVQGVDLREARRREREQLARFFVAAGLINASLDHERVLDQALELASQALIDSDDKPELLVGMLFLLAGD